MVIRAVVLAAGQGLRLRPVWSRGPKALLELRGKALIEHVISRLCQVGVEEICVVCGYMGENLARFLKAIQGRYTAGLRVAWCSDYMREWCIPISSEGDGWRGSVPGCDV